MDRSLLYLSDVRHGGEQQSADPLPLSTRWVLSGQPLQEILSGVCPSTDMTATTRAICGLPGVDIGMIAEVRNGERPLLRWLQKNEILRAGDIVECKKDLV